jgi:hypothetical protein
LEGFKSLFLLNFQRESLEFARFVSLRALVQGVEQVLVEAAAWADSIGETANAPTRRMDLTEFA